MFGIWGRVNAVYAARRYLFLVASENACIRLPLSEHQSESLLNPESFFTGWPPGESSREAFGGETHMETTPKVDLEKEKIVHIWWAALRALEESIWRRILIPKGHCHRTSKTLEVKTVQCPVLPVLAALAWSIFCVLTAWPWSLETNFCREGGFWCFIWSSDRSMGQARSPRKTEEGTTH